MNHGDHGDHEMGGMTTAMDHGDHEMSGHEMSMTMFFNLMMPFTVVFKGWEVTDSATLIGSCFGVFGMAIMYELLKNLRQVWKVKFERRAIQASMGDCCSEEGDDFTYRKKNRQYWIHLLTQSFLHIAQMFLAYVLMLVVMAYNVWLFVAVLAGGSVGYFLSALIFEQPVENKRLKGKDNHGMFETEHTSNGTTSSQESSKHSKF